MVEFLKKQGSFLYEETTVDKPLLKVSKITLNVFLQAFEFRPTTIVEEHL